MFGALNVLPPTNLQVGKDELLLDASARLAERAARNGAEVRLDVFEGMYHMFQRAVGGLETAETALRIAAGFVEDRRAGPAWP